MGTLIREKSIYIAHASILLVYSFVIRAYNVLNGEIPR